MNVPANSGRSYLFGYFIFLSLLKHVYCAVWKFYVFLNIHISLQSSSNLISCMCPYKLEQSLYINKYFWLYVGVRQCMDGFNIYQYLNINKLTCCENIQFLFRFWFFSLFMQHVGFILILFFILTKQINFCLNTTVFEMFIRTCQSTTYIHTYIHLLCTYT